MKFLFLTLAVLICSSFTVQKEEKSDGYKFRKIEFDGHTYILLIDSWSHSGNFLLHDPSCECVKKALEKLEKKK